MRAVWCPRKDDLKSLSDRHKFRADRYYRIGVAIVDLPPLRERREDIPLPFEHFMSMAASRYGRAAPLLGHAQLADLMAYEWPGNLREPRNVADRFVLGLPGERLTQPRKCVRPPRCQPIPTRTDCQPHSPQRSPWRWRVIRNPRRRGAAAVVPER